MKKRKKIDDEGLTTYLFFVIKLPTFIKIKLFFIYIQLKYMMTIFRKYFAQPSNSHVRNWENFKINFAGAK